MGQLHCWSGKLPNAGLLALRPAAQLRNDTSRSPVIIVIVVMRKKKPENRSPKGYADKVAAMPQVLMTSEPGSSLIRPTPVRNAFGGQVIGSTARLRRRTSGRWSPVKSIR